MNDQSIQKREKWLKRIQNSRHYYWFQKWRDKSKSKKNSPFDLLRWIFNDFIYLIKWNINLLLQLKRYGVSVKRYSGLSLTQQWVRMAYLVFVIQADSNKFRKNHLFDEGRWKKADKFSYGRHRSIHREIEGFLYDDEVRLVINKFEFYKYCQEQGWKTPAILAIFENGKCTYPENAICNIPEKDLFVKQLDGGHGRGTKYFLHDRGKYYDLNGNVFDSDKLLSYLVRESKLGKGLILQNAIKNHIQWKKFSNGSLATCRIVTGRSPDDSSQIKPFFASLRMPVGNADADNYNMGGLGAGINIKTGVLGKAISAKPIDNCFGWDVHPDTGKKITGSTLYKWNSVVQFAQEIHQKFRSLAIAWDIALTEDGLFVIEANALWGSDIVEGPLNSPMYETRYSVWVEDWIKILSQNKNQSRSFESNEQ